MSSLAAFQTRMAETLWRGAGESVLTEISPGLIAADAALGVHRNTIMSGLTNALRLTYPTVDWLVGADFFDQTALAYARIHPPAKAQLSDYGQQFPVFLEGYAPAAELPYLADVARFDLAVDQVAALSIGGSTISVDLDEGVTLRLEGSLRVLRLRYPADRLRDARDDDDQSLEDLDMSPRDYAYALWRGEAGASVRAVPAGVAAFLDAVLACASAQDGLDALLQEAGEAGLAQLQSDLFFAPFARLQTTQTEETAT
jgi:hypothetical protein